MARPPESTLAETPSGYRRKSAGTGDAVGRFVLDQLLGEGGMGVVYTAHDPQLGRRVALKLVRADSASSTSRGRMLREAQAMARLMHPNVVVVHEAGTVDDQVYIAMELVEGSTLHGWMTAAPRGWRETLALLAQAGRGLAAAHAAGIVHRDFKPANVLVGKDGRAHVTDFGLARDAGEVSSDGGPVPLDSSEITKTGTVLGTPAYMAPEQIQGEKASPRADQFSFCVSLCEALFGSRPTRADGWRLPPSRPGVPAGVRRILARGLAREPADRWPSMEALLDALDAATRPRRLWLAGAAVALAGGLASVALSMRAPEPDPCPDAALRLTGVWDAPRRQELRGALGATHGPVVEKLVDDYTAGWVARRNQACAATVAEETPSAVLDARVACLDQRFENLRAWLDVFVHAGSDAASRAADSARARDDLAMCDDAEAMLEPMPQDRALRERVGRLRVAVAAQNALRDAGRHDAAYVGLLGLHAAAGALDYLPVEAEAAFSVAVMLRERGETLPSLPWFRKSAELAEEARYDLARARAWRGQAQVLNMLYRYDESMAAWSYATAALRPMTGWQVDVERTLLDAVEAMNLWGQGKLDEALVVHRRATAADAKLRGTSGTRHASMLYNEANILFELGRLDEAEAVYRAVDALYFAIGGEEHPMRARIIGALGNLAYKRGDHEAALRMHRRALELKLLRSAPDSFTMAFQHTNIGAALLALHRPEEALRELTVAREIVLAQTGGKNALLGEVSSHIGQAHLMLGKPADAILPLEEAIGALESAKDTSPWDLAAARFALARALWGTGRDRPRARSLVADARRGADPKLIAEIDAWEKQRH